MYLHILYLQLDKTKYAEIKKKYNVQNSDIKCMIYRNCLSIKTSGRDPQLETVMYKTFRYTFAKGCDKQVKGEIKISRKVISQLLGFHHSS